MSKRKRRPSPAPIALTSDELHRLLERAKSDDFVVYVLMLIQYWHAGRNSEMIHLTRDNFADGFIIYKRGKGSEPCKQQLVADADPLLNERQVVTEFLLNLSPVQRLFNRSRWTYWRRLKAIALACGIPGHKAKTTVLKHSICTHVYKKFGVAAARRRAGHVNGANTLIYAAASEAEVDALIAGEISSALV